MKKDSIVLRLDKYTYTGLYIFAQGIHDGVQMSPALYPAPVPSLSVFQTAINLVRDSYEEYGDYGRNGGDKEKAKLLQACDMLRGYIRSYANYVMVMQPDNPLAWEKAGFPLKKQPAKTSRVGAVQNFHQFIARNIAKGDIKLKWERPLDVHPKLMIAYKIYRSADTIFANASLINVTMNKATYIDTPGKAGMLFYYWAIPVTTAGDGVLSEMCTAFASPV